MTIREIEIRVITPSAGKVLTDGNVYSERVYLGAEDTPDRWSEAEKPEDSADNYDGAPPGGL